MASRSGPTESWDSAMESRNCAGPFADCTKASRLNIIASQARVIGYSGRAIAARPRKMPAWKRDAHASGARDCGVYVAGRNQMRGDIVAKRHARGDTIVIS